MVTEGRVGGEGMSGRAAGTHRRSAVLWNAAGVVVMAVTLPALLILTFPPSTSAAPTYSSLYGSDRLPTHQTTLDQPVRAETVRLQPQKTFPVGLPSNVVTQTVATVATFPGLVAVSDEAIPFVGLNRYNTARLMAE